tara:strand:+ start:329 stop:772 length:444 start_codon:yes stop_codon:yes gene_type:complete
MAHSDEILKLLINIKDTYIGEMSNTTVDSKLSDSLGLSVDSKKLNELNNILNKIKLLLHNNGSLKTFKNITDIDICKSILYTFYTINLDHDITINLDHDITNNNDSTIIQEFQSLLLSNIMNSFFINITRLNLYEYCDSILMNLENM